MAQERKPVVRRTAEQQVEHHRAKLEAARAKLAKAERDRDTRRKVVAGAALIGLAEAGDAEAARVLDRIKAGLTRPQDRKAFGLDAVAGPTEAELVTAIEAALAAHGVAKQEGRSPAAEARTWREAVVAWERLTGRSWIKDDSPENRRKMGLGGVGELLSPAKAA